MSDLLNIEVLELEDGGHLAVADEIDSAGRSFRVLGVVQGSRVVPLFRLLQGDRVAVVGALMQAGHDSGGAAEIEGEPV